MAYGVKYRCEYTDIHGVDWNWIIEKDGFTDPETVLQASGKAGEIEWMCDDDVMKQQIIPSKAQLTVESPSVNGLSDLFTSNLFEYRVRVYKGTNLIDSWDSYPAVDDPFETLTTSGGAITSAITSDEGLVLSNTFSLTAYQTITVSFFLTLNSGTVPKISLYNPVNGYTISEADCAEGWNEIDLTGLLARDDYRVAIYSSVATNFTTSAIATNGASTDLFWQGFVVANNYEEPYDNLPFSITIGANDSLSLLKEYEFNDLNYSVRQYASQIIHDILELVEIDEFTEYINLYEDDMITETYISPMEQIKIDPVVFEDKDCYYALSNILSSFNAGIRQDGGKYIIYRYVETADVTMYGRAFTAAPATYTPITQSPEQIISRPGDTSSFEDQNGGMKRIIPAEKLTLYQDYKSKDSWIKNFEFKGETYNGTNWTDWNNEASFVKYGLNGEEDGIVMQCSNGGTVDAWVNQVFAPLAVSTSDVLKFSFDYLTFNLDNTEVVGAKIYIKVKATGANQYLYNFDDRESKWNASNDFIEITINCPVGSSGWQSFTTDILDGLPTTGSYTITLYEIEGNTNLLYASIKNIRLYAVSDVINRYRTKEYYAGFSWLAKWKNQVEYIDRPERVCRKYIKTNTYGVLRDYSYAIGDVEDADIDNVLEQFAGSLAVNVYNEDYEVNTITLSGSSGTAVISCAGLEKTATFDTSLIVTAANFVTDFAADYLAEGVEVTADSGVLTFTSQTLGLQLDTTITPATPDLDGVVAMTNEYYYMTIEPTAIWNTRGGSEATELIDLIGDELKAQYATPKQVLDLPVFEASASTFLKLTGNLQDSYNQVGGNNRIFAIGRAIYDTKNRQWNLGLTEIL